MTRHLSACQASRSPSGGGFHLLVDQPRDKTYWLHLAVSARAPLRKLDDFLRRIWLECCGHLSAFTIGEQRYASIPMRELDESGMRAPAGSLLAPGLKFSYEYDYGSTTALTLKVLGERDELSGGKAVTLLARNDPPEIFCESCGEGKRATRICTECAWSGAGWLCDECAETHECGPDMQLPVVNSPRAGVCAYGT